MKRNRILHGLGAISLWGVVACGGAPAEPPREETTRASTSLQPEPGQYVALGDSYAAIGSRAAPLHGDQFCLRSADNYPHLIESAVIDVTCQGAVTADLLAPRYTGTDYLPPQLDALGEATTLVTVSIGGNDLGFGDVAGCIRQRMDTDSLADCAEVLGNDIQNRLELVPAQLDEVHRQIQHRAGDARVIVTGYLPLLWAGECPELGAVSQADREWALALTTQINQIVRAAAQRHDAEFILPAGAEEHTSCAAPAERWVDIRGTETDAYPMHLTSAGHKAMAEAVQRVSH